jgi:hypothetical protein
MPSAVLISADDIRARLRPSRAGSIAAWADHTLIPVECLREGDMVDLEGDPWADPDHDPVLAYEYASVHEVTFEGPNIVAVCFDHDVVGFPTSSAPTAGSDHLALTSRTRGVAWRTPYRAPLAGPITPRRAPVRGRTARHWTTVGRPAGGSPS